MTKAAKPTQQQLTEENEDLRARLAEAEETLRAIREGEIDAVIVSGSKGEQIFSLVGTDLIYRLIVETMKEAAFTLTFDGVVLFCNAQFGQFVKRPMNQIIGRPFREFVAPDNFAAAESLVIVSQEQPVRQRLVLRDSEDRWVPVHVSANVLKQPDNMSICVVATDLTELENSTELIQQLRRQQEALQEVNRELAAAEEELRRSVQDLDRSNKDLEAFAYVASHDLQEPLRMVIGFLDMLQSKCKDQLDENAREYIAYSVEGATRMSLLIKDLLEYSRVGAKGKAPAPVDLSAVVDYVKGNLRAMILETNAVIVADPLPTVMADMVLMRQLFQNLLDNALKFRAEGRYPEIHIGARQDANEWLFRVKDNGIGIAPEQRDRVFVIFQRLHNRKKYEGTGIGLAICKKIVERHGGRIWVESEPGEGSTFCFTLPACSQSEAQSPSRKAH